MTPFEDDAPPVPSNEPERFTIDNEERANWLLRKLANIEGEKQRVQAQAAAIVKQLDADAANLRRLYESELEHFARKMLVAQGNRRRSLQLLQGTLAFRTQAASIKISDTAAALEYAHRNALEAVRTQVTLDTAVYRQAAESALKNGELLPGVEMTPARETFKIDFGKAAD